MNNLRFTENLKSAVTGNTVERYSFDAWGRRAWGRRRNPQTLSYDNVTTASFDRGYTLHEHYDEFGLINMNGTVYNTVPSTFPTFWIIRIDELGLNNNQYCKKL